MLPCRVFVVIRNGMKSVFMSECNLYGWVCFFQGRYIFKNINVVYICSNMLCAHHKTRQETSYYKKTLITTNN